MAGRSLKQAFQVEWFNVTYRSVVLAVVTCALLLAAGGTYWFYFHRYSPRSEAAIGRAAARLDEASRQRAEGQIREIVGSAGAALGEARSEFVGRRFDHAMVAAIRSENLSLQALNMARGDDSKSVMVRFYRIEGDVRVKASGDFSWQAATPQMVLQIGDQVKTSSSASAQLLYFDGTVTTIRPGSLLEIRDVYEDPVTLVRRVKESLSWGELRSSTQKRNVSGSYHEVSTAKVTARSEGAGEFRVAYDQERKTSEFDVFDGRIQLQSPGRQESLVGGERLRADADGRLRAKESLPGVPRLITPSDQKVFVFDDPGRQRLNLAWEAVPNAAKYQLTISDKPLFTSPLYDDQRTGASARLEGLAVGSYYWKVSAVSASGVVGPPSPTRRFRISSDQIRDRSDVDPPSLEITDFVAIGTMVIVNGRTEPGVNLWVDSEKIEVDASGTFYAVVRLRKEGLNELQFVAQDNAGNESTVRRTALVETF